MTALGTPYRLGATSYVWPAGLVANVRRLAPLVDDVELVLFDVAGRSNLPGRATVRALRALAERHALTYTVHLPLDLSPAEPASLDMAARVVDCTRDLAPWAYVVHLDGRAVEGRPGAAVLARWQSGARDALDRVVDLAGDPARVCVENLENYAPEHLMPVVAAAGVGLCLDVGHLWLMGRDPLPVLDAHLARTRVVHLHGLNGRDHQSLRHQEPGAVAAVLERLAARAYAGVVTLEVFGLPDFRSSRALVARLVAAPAA